MAETIDLLDALIASQLFTHHNRGLARKLLAADPKRYGAAKVRPRGYSRATMCSWKWTLTPAGAKRLAKDLKGAP